MIDAHLTLRLIHIVSATILFGTGIGTAFHLFVANRRGEIGGIRAATHQVVLADFLFTAPAGLTQLASGLALVYLGGYSLTEPWIAWALALFTFALACWLPVVWMQIVMRRLAHKAFDRGETLPERYWRLDRWWILLGALAFPALLAVFALMVFKPT